MKDTIKAYQKAYQENFKLGETAFAEEFHFHDSGVRSCRKNGKHLTVTFDDSDGPMPKIIFKNCTVVQQDRPLRGAWWLYEEIYPHENGYEIHALLWKEDLVDFIVRAEAVLLQ